MNTVWILIWFSVYPEQGVRYYTVGTYDNETMCRSALKEASVIVNDKQETIDCIGVTIR
tara:strand:+ start:93 stop:269 length:177 start_codon:yes stop_codon:yes gene_type:complete